MRWYSEIRERLRALVAGGDEERQTADELRFHLDMQVEENVRRGMTPEEARRQAALKLGGAIQVREATRDARGLRWLDDLARDLRVGTRMLVHAPGFTTTAVATLALGIAAATAVFGLANAMLFRPIPGVHDAGRLAHVRFQAPHLEDEEVGISYLNFVDLHAMELPGIEDLVGWAEGRHQVAVLGRATALLNGAAVVGGYFGALGARPEDGRLFGIDETWSGDGEPIVVLSERARARLFGEDPVVGRSLVINGIPFTVVGVAGDGFRGVYRSDGVDFWIPYGVYPRIRHFDEEVLLHRGSSQLHDVVVRMAPGVTPGIAGARLGAAVDRLRVAYPEANAHLEDYRPTLFPEIGLSPRTAGRTRRTMAILLGAVGLVLLIACANVANLLIFRGVRRRGESAVRQALGASRVRLLRQHLAESGLLAAAGVGVGLGVTALGLRLFAGLMPVEMPPATIDLRVVAFAVAAGAAAVLLAGLVPAVVVHRVELVRSLKAAAPTETGRRLRLRAGLTMTQLGLSLALLVAALLLVRTVRGLEAVELGFDPEGLIQVVIDPEPQGYDEARANRFQSDVLLGLAELPGASSASLATGGPLRVYTAVRLRPSGVESDEVPPVEAYADYVTPRYFETAGIRLLRGRTFTLDELDASWRKESDVVVLNETLARRVFGDVDPVGRTVSYRGFQGEETLRVIGVVADSRTRTLDAPVAPALYRPLGEHYANDFSIFIRSAAPTQAVLGSVRALIDRLDPALPFYLAGPVSDRIAERTVEQRFLANLMALLAMLAAVLAGIGLYGVVGYSVAERTREIGIRMALGARGGRVVAGVLRQSLALAAGGLVLGAGAAWALARMLESRLYGVEPLDPLTWLTAAVAFGVLALLAAAAPARAATRVDPVRALKT